MLRQFLYWVMLVASYSNTDVPDAGQSLSFDGVEVIDDGLLGEVIGGSRSSLKASKHKAH